MMRKGARVLAAELLREPVKQAVREALHEEIAAVESESGEIKTRTAHESESGGGWRSQSSSKKGRSGGSSSSNSSSSGGGRSKFATLGIVLAIAGITYFARQRMSSTSGRAWSEQSAGSVATDDAEGGYVSEGEMQTAETADESTTGTSTSTTADQ